MSGRSSAYGDTVTELLPSGGSRGEVSGAGLPPEGDSEDPEPSEQDMDTNQRLHSLRIQLLDRLVQYIPEIREVGGVRAIPFMQVHVYLSST